MKVYVVNPKTNCLVRAIDWVKQDNPESAEYIVIETNIGSRFRIYKKCIGNGKKLTYKKASKLLKELKLSSEYIYTLGNISQWENIYYALRSADFNVNELLCVIGGDPITDNNWRDMCFYHYNLFPKFFNVEDNTSYVCYAFFYRCFGRAISNYIDSPSMHNEEYDFGHEGPHICFDDNDLPF